MLCSCAALVRRASAAVSDAAAAAEDDPERCGHFIDSAPMFCFSTPVVSFARRRMKGHVEAAMAKVL
jgi:hypothetical protein